MTDGIYINVFCVKDGLKYEVKTLPLNELSLALTNSLMDGLEKVVSPDEEVSKYE